MTTYHLLLAAHLVLAVFAVGPLVHAATTAARGVRTGDEKAAASASRVLRIYSYVSVLVLLVGIPLMKQKPFGSGGSSIGTPRPYADYLPTDDKPLGEFSDTYIWLSIVLWVIAIAVVLGVIVPTLHRVIPQVGVEGQTDVTEPAGARTARVAAAGGIVALAFAAIVVLMAFRPGQ